MRGFYAIIIVILICLSLSGCGETISGVGKDINRVGRGVSTVFFRQ